MLGGFAEVRQGEPTVTPWQVCVRTATSTILRIFTIRKGVASSPEKVKAVQIFPTPTCMKEVRSFLGLASFYRRLVPQFAEIAKPLTSLTRKDQPFTWGPSRQEAFRKLKEKLCTTPVLTFPDFSLPFILTTDASKTALGAILSQVLNGEEAHCLRQQAKK